MRKPVFRGSSVAMITPFTPQGEVDFEAFDSLLDWLIEEQSDSLTVCATTGEGSTLSDEEFVTLIRRAVVRAGGRAPIIAGTGRNDTAHSLELSLAAKKAGADALLMVTPYYNKTSQRGLVSHFTYLADRVDLPIILYNVPSRTGMSIAADTYAQLAKHPGIYGVKEASGDLGLLLKLRRLCPDDFALYSGNDDQIVPILAMGGLGVISVLANVTPRIVHEICRKYFEGDTEGAMSLQIKYSPLIEALFCETNPIPVKAAMSMLDKACAALRLPLVPMEEKNRLRLYQELNALGLV